MRQNYDPKVLLPLKGDTGAFFSKCNKTENAKLAKRKFYLKIWTNILRNIFFFLSSKYAITTLFRYADEGFIFLNRQFDIYLMLNQYFDSALPVVDTCLRLQSRNQANLFFLKIVKKISSWSLTDDLRSREIHSFINM